MDPDFDLSSKVDLFDLLVRIQQLSGIAFEPQALEDLQTAIKVSSLFDDGCFI